MKTLIIFATRRGNTEHAALIIAETLVLKYEHDVEMLSIRNKRQINNTLADYDNVIVGSSISRGKWVRRANRFLRRNRFEHQKVALFVVDSGSMNRAVLAGMSKREAADQAVKKYIDPYLEKFNFTPIAKSAFGGSKVKTRIRRINHWSRKDIESWAMQVGKLFAG